MNIITKVSCVSRIFFSVVLYLLPSHEQICEYSCENLLCYNFVPRLSLNHYLGIFAYSFVETCGASFLYPSSLEIIIHDFFLYSFAFVTKPLGKFVNILAYACCVSFLSPNFFEIIIQELFSL